MTDAPTAPTLPLRTERLVLRAAVPSDLPALLSYYGDPVVVRHLLHDVLDEALVAEKLKKFQANTAPGSVGDTLSLVVEHDGEVAGDLMLRFTFGDPPSVAEVGWVFNPAYAGQGFATEAARAMLDLGFRHFGLHRIFAQLDARNASSARLCERLGMTREAHFRKDFWSKGEWTDSAHYGLLREEWAG
ncbi:MAG: GNAT family N-acetyltransferase [Actinomycetota bacterium]|nr:GNAT family N-acetyltransferase [Actinomycetota bacterium]